MNITLLKNISIFCLVYVIFMVLNTHIFHIELTILNAIMNLITIPILLFVIFGFIYSFVKIWKKQKGFKPIFILNFCSILIMISTTIFEKM